MHYQCSRIAAGGTLEMNGFVIRLAPAPAGRDARDDAVFVEGDNLLTCEVKVIAPDGRSVFEEQAYRLDTNPATGQDINRDGHPDAVLHADSGGAHCCNTYYIDSLGQDHGLISQIYTRNSTASFQDLDGDGSLEILPRDDSFSYFDLSFADSPMPLVVLRLEGKTFRDVGPEFPELYDEQISEAQDRLNGLEFSNLDDFNPNTLDVNYNYAKGKILSIVLSYLYSGRPREARKAFDQYWHAAPPERQRVREEIIKNYCGGLRSKLGSTSGSSCNREEF